jgi:ADP-ribose pyrophosphatase
VLKEKSYLDTGGREARWTYIERRERRKAAVIVATTKRSDSLVLIEQFRIPFEDEVFEFHAGMIDAGETPEQTARRELVEETGFEGEVLRVGPGVSTTAGLSTEIVYMVYMRVGEEPAGRPQLEGSERIRVLKIRPEEFGSFLSECERDRRILDAKLYIYLKDHLPRRKET